jgi:hypothetical protein
MDILIPMTRRAALTVCGAALLQTAGCATRRDGITGVETHRRAPTLRDVTGKYYEGCVCKDKVTFQKHNCTHYLSNAYILAGFTELLDWEGFTERCKAGRPVRAQEFLKWMQTKAVRYSQGRPPANSGIWAGYQEKDGLRHHILIIDTDRQKYFGTTDCVSWPIQWFYQW